MQKLLLRLCVVVSAIMFAVPVMADGFMVPVHQPTGDVFTVKYHHVDVFIDGQAAVTKVDQVFHNETNREEEGTYIFPLPKGAAISKFSMFAGEQELKGKILDKDEARRLYESIVRQRKDPALLEYIDRNTFRARVYPIPANGDKRIRLEYNEIINKTNTLCRYVYPLSTERFSAKPLDDARVTIHLKAKTAISNIYSPSHIVKVEQRRPTEATVTWTASNVKPDQDIVLYYSLQPSDVAMDVLTFKESGKQGYFMLLASPKVSEQAERVVPKNVVFVLDRTGSMAGDKIVQARNALKYCLNSLNPQDRFSLITFNESPDALWNGLQLASETNIDKAIKTVEKLDATGGTNINDAMKRALQMCSLRSDAFPTYVVFLTDGVPTVGETDIEAILKNAKAANGGARVFAFGVGYDVNTHLLDLLAEQSGGQPEYVLPNEDIEAKVSAFYAKVSQPMVTRLSLKANGVRAFDMFPFEPLPDLFKGSQLIVLGRYDGGGKATFTLSGDTGQGRKTWDVSVNLPNEDTERDFVPQIWAARKMGYLLDQVRLHRSDELIKEIVQLSKEWGIPTEFTSFFVDESRIAAADAIGRVQAKAGAAREADSGQWGVNQSLNSGALRDQAQVFASSPAAAGAPGPAGPRMGNVRGYFNEAGESVVMNQIQNVGARTFYQRGNQWVDNQVEENENLKKVQIKQFSDAHFKLLAALPELNKYQKLGNVTLFVNNQALEIGPEGKEDLTDAEVKAITGNPRASKETHRASTGSLPDTHGAGPAGVVVAAIATGIGAMKQFI